MRKPVLEPYRESMDNINCFKCKKSRFALTLIEILAALLVLTLALLPAIGSLSTYYSTATRQVEQETALKIAESVANQLQTIDYGSIVDKIISDVQLDIETSEGNANGTLKFQGWNGSSGDIQINRISYKIDVEIKKLFSAQSLTSPHNEAMKFDFIDFDDLEKVEVNNVSSSHYESLDDAFIFDIKVSFGNAIPIRLTSFRADMVK